MQTEEAFVKNEKFRLIREISSMLRDAPSAVRRAWQDGWTDIGFYPKGYTSMDSCGCCGTDHPTGWYGYSTEIIPLMPLCEDHPRKFRFICDASGGKEYAPSSWTLME